MEPPSELSLQFTNWKRDNAPDIYVCQVMSKFAGVTPFNLDKLFDACRPSCSLRGGGGGGSEFVTG